MKRVLYLQLPGSKKEESPALKLAISRLDTAVQRGATTTRSLTRTKLAADVLLQWLKVKAAFPLFPSA